MMRRIILLFCYILVIVPAFSQDSIANLTFKEAIQIALRNNANLNQARNNLNQFQSQKLFRIGQMGPQVTASGNVFRNNGNSFIQQEAKTVNATVDVVQASLNVTMPVFNGLFLFNNARLASSQLDAQLAFVKRSTEDVINSVAIQYLQVLLDQELVTIAEENLGVQQKTYEQLKAQVELGSRSPVDEFNQKALLSNAEISLAQAKYTLSNDKIALFQLLLWDPTIPTRVNEPSWDVNAIALDELDLPALVSLALESRSDLKQAQFNQKAARFGLASSRGNFFPSINAFYNYGSAYNQLKGTPRDSTYRDFQTQFFTDNKYQTLGLSLYVPLFTGFQNRYTYVQSRVLYENNKVLTDSREITVKGDVVRAYENYQAIKIAYAASVAGLEASEIAFNLEQERFNLGITNFVDFANANRTLVLAQTNMAQAKYRFLFQKIMLDYATGTLKPESLP